MQKAIIDKDTGIVLRLTTDDNPSFLKNEEIVELQEKIDLANGPVKIDNGEIVSVTKEEFDLVDFEEKNKKKREQLTIIISDIADNGATLEKIQDYFKLLK